MIDSWWVGPTEEGPGELVYTFTAFAAAAKHARRKLKMLKPGAVRRRWERGGFDVHRVRPYRLAHDTVVYAADLAHARKLEPNGIIVPVSHFEGLRSLCDMTLVAQACYVWPLPPHGSVKPSDWIMRYAPDAYSRAVRPAKREIPFTRTQRDRIAIAICLAIADPSHAPPASYVFRHPSEFDAGAGNSAKGPVTPLAFERRHPDVAPRVVRRLREAAGPTLTYPPSVLGAVREFVESYGLDPETLTWGEIRALWMRAEKGLAQYRALGHHPTDRFEDTNRRPRAGEYA